MGFFFRRSKKVGPFRINLSTSGVGVSAGVKGARVSMGPKGTFVHLGKGGIYYRKKIGSGYQTKHQPINPAYDTKEIYVKEPHSITSENFDQLSDSSSQEFIRELEEKDRKLPFLPLFGIIPSVLFIIFFIVWTGQVASTIDVGSKVFSIDQNEANIREKPDSRSRIVSVGKSGEQYPILETEKPNWIKVITHQNDTGYVYTTLGNMVEIESGKVERTRFYGFEWLRILLIVITVTGLSIWCRYLYNVDKKRKSIELYYSMEDEFADTYNSFIAYFDEFSKSKKVWQKLHSKRVTDTKYTAGANNLVNRITLNQIKIDSKPTTFIKTNVQIPHIGLKNTELYFFPERVVLKRKGRFASVFYQNLNIDYYPIRFVEDERVPKDAEIIDSTWKYVNKRGGPDKRFKDNVKLPICEYSEYHFQSQGGINEVINTSKYSAMDKFAELIEHIGRVQSQIN